MTEKSQKVYIAIPVFNHEARLTDILVQIDALGLPAVVVDDGSVSPLAKLSACGRNITLLRHPVNIGKGAAIRTASEYALSQGAETLVTIDADGQHNPEEITAILEKVAENNNQAIIIGSRKFENKKIPLSSKIGRMLSNFLVYLETGVELSDTQSGFRAYPLKIFHKFSWSSSGYEFETEILVKSLLSGIPCKEVAVSVSYPPDRISHFRICKESARFTVLHSKLILHSIRNRIKTTER